MSDNYTDYYKTITDAIITLLANDSRLDEISDNLIYNFDNKVIPKTPAILVLFDRFVSEDQDWGDSDSDRTVEEMIYHIITIYVKDFDLIKVQNDLTKFITAIKNVLTENETLDNNVEKSRIVAGEINYLKGKEIQGFAELNLTSWKQTEIS